MLGRSFVSLVSCSFRGDELYNRLAESAGEKDCIDVYRGPNRPATASVLVELAKTILSGQCGGGGTWPCIIDRMAERVNICEPAGTPASTKRQLQ